MWFCWNSWSDRLQCHKVAKRWYRGWIDLGRWVSNICDYHQYSRSTGETPGIGAYSKSTYATEKLYFKVPSSVKQTDAATIPLACTTAWLAMFSSRCLGVDREASDKTPLLIWGGSCKSVTVQLGAQIWLFEQQVLGSSPSSSPNCTRSLLLQYVAPDILNCANRSELLGRLTIMIKT